MKSKIYEYFTAYNLEHLLFKIQENDNNGVLLKIYTDGLGVYHKSNGEALTNRPHCVECAFSFEQTVDLIASFIEAISHYFNNQIFNQEDLPTIIKLKDKIIEIRKINNSFGKRERIQIIVFEEDKEIFCFKITRVPLIYLCNTIKIILDEQKMDKHIKVEIYNNFNTVVSHTKNSLTINKLPMRFIDRAVISNFTSSIITDRNTYIENIKGKDFSFSENKILNAIEVIIAKSRDSKESYSFKINPKFIASLYLLNCVDASINISDKNKNDLKLINMQKLNIHNIVNFNGYIGFSCSQEKYDFKSKNGMPLLHISANDFQAINIDLQENFFKFFAGLISPMSEEDFEQKDRLYNATSLTVKVFEGILTKTIKMAQFQQKGKDNTLSISKIFNENVEEKFFTSIQPIKVIQLKHILVKLLPTIKDFKFYIKHQNIEKLILRVGKKDGVVRIHDSDMIKEPLKVLNNSDCLKLYLSACNKILCGYWLSFQGELISINNNSTISTIKHEYNLDKNADNGYSNALKVIAVVGENISESE